eukprot:TRINITY_DN55170_c0_g1_i1.p1 TRINITY_DN55170_c0_g1~~TRINITY_DN55170_c0_g1_i1.p1  ORF type:complete len:1073 (-),score=160.40 TRINITY_DN55170_c0_g1_i1:276-3494(-)
MNANIAGLAPSPSASMGLMSRLTPYQVGLCSLLVRYAQVSDAILRHGGEPICDDDEEAEQRLLFDFIRREVQAAWGPRRRDLRELDCELRRDSRQMGIWLELCDRLRDITSPDALFNVFQDLEAAVAREVTSASPLHASGIFGQYARLCILAFRDASFEATVKLCDAVRASVEELDSDDSLGISSISPATSAVMDGGGAVPVVGMLQVEQLAKGLMRDLPLSFGRVPFPVIDSALAVLQEKLPLCHVVHFLRHVNSMEHRLSDDAAMSLRAFHDGHQQGGLTALRAASGWPAGAPLDDNLPDLIQHASLALAGLHAEMRHIDDALQALGESIRAAQEASDAPSLCACLYTLSIVLLQAGFTGKAFTMMRRCLHRADALGLPMLQSLCCLGIAQSLSVQPALANRRQRGLLWRESISRMAESQPVMRSHNSGGATIGGSSGGGFGGAGGGIAGSGLAGIGARVFGFAGGGINGGTTRGSLGVLGALLSDASRDDGSADGTSSAGAADLAGSGVGGGGVGGHGTDAEGTVCRDALAHVTLASLLSTQAGTLNESRPRVLLCQAEVARLFGLHELTSSTSELVLKVYNDELVGEDRALAMCQLAIAAAERSFVDAQPLLRGVAQQIPHAGYLWAHIVGPRVVRTLLKAGECSAVSALLFQVAGVLRAVPHGSVISAAQRLRLTNNSVRLYHRQLLPAYQSAHEAAEGGIGGGSPCDLCSHLLCLADVHLTAQDPIGALGPSLRCLSVAESTRLLNFRAEAMVRLARAKLELRDLAGALQLAEEATPQLGAVCSARLRGEALALQADVLFALMGRTEDETTRRRLLREIVSVLRSSASAFEAVAELNPLRRCHYLLARACHELGDFVTRDHHSTRFRVLSEFFDDGGSGAWSDLGLAVQEPPRTDSGLSPRGEPLSPVVQVAASQQHSTEPSPRPVWMASLSPHEMAWEMTGNASLTSVKNMDANLQASQPRSPQKRRSPAGLLSKPGGPTENEDAGRQKFDGFTGTTTTGNQCPCPALAQLLSMAESAHNLPPWPSDGLAALRPQALDSRSSDGVPTVVGDVRGLYPMAAAVLGA